MVSLLSLAHERGCEAELAGALTEQMQQHPSPADKATAGVIDIQSLRARFAPVRATMPEVSVNLPPIASYDALLPSLGEAA